jgi:hypothetical protein
MFADIFNIICLVAIGYWLRSYVQIQSNNTGQSAIDRALEAIETTTQRAK